MITDTIVAPITPEGKGGVSIIRISGNKSKELCNKLIQQNKKILNRRPSLFSLYLKNKSCIDQAIITYYKKPASYTGEDVIEISCHGSPIIVKTILNTLCFYGARIANPGEFTMRAFLKGKMDLVQAESISTLIESKSLRAIETHNKILSGALSKKINKLKQSLLFLISTLEYELDVSDEDLSKKTKTEIYKQYKNTYLDCEELLNSYSKKDSYFNSKITICGEPNVGKSTLLNSLVGENKAITSSIPGTTRDRIEVNLEIKNTPITLIDTAGLRKTKNEIEKIGLKKTNEAIQEADIIIYVLTKDSNFKKIKNKKNTILVFNKSDIYNKPKHLSKAISTAAIYGTGIKKLKKEIENTIEKRTSKFPNVFLTTQRQYIYIYNCLKFLKLSNKYITKTDVFEPEIISLNFRESLKQIDHFLGKTTIEEILNKVFSNFCVGK